MMIDVACPGCQKNWSVKDQYAGRPLQCPACDAMMAVSDPNAKPTPPPAPKPMATASPASAVNS